MTAFLLAWGVVWLAAPPTFVTRVVDGDTLIVDTIGRVRLVGVDTPETTHPTRPPHPCGREATAFTVGLVARQTVTLTLDAIQGRTDRHGRRLAYVHLQDGTLLNAELVRAGFGTVYRGRFTEKARFQRYEHEARAARRGCLWRAEPPVR